MSAITAIIATAVVTQVMIPAGAFVIGKCLKAFSKSLSAEGKTAFENDVLHLTTKWSALKSVAQIRSEHKPLLAGSPKPHTENLEQVKGRILAELARQPYLIKNQENLQTGFSALRNAQSFETVEKARQLLAGAIETEHQQIFAETVLKTCQAAAVKLGFAKIESLNSPLASVVRFAAIDESGRALITEVTAPKNRDVKIETEVFGVTDGSCSDILDAFQQALKTEGLQSLPPKRRFTGGVCELDAVKRFAERKLAPPTQPANPTNSGIKTGSTTRSRNLNRRTQNQHQK